MAWVWRDGRLIERGSPEDYATRPAPRRSVFPAPMVRSDALDDVRSMADGKTYDSKAALYRSYRERGVRIVEKGEGAETESVRGVRDDVHAALARVRAGYKPAPLMTESRGAALEE